MRAFDACVCVALCCVLLVGCGGDSSSSSSGDTSSGSGTSAPMKGKDLKDADQLLGGWVTADALEDDFVGMEFLAEGSVLFSMDGGSAEKMKFSVMEGGRLSMEDPASRQTMIWGVKLAGDQMELSTERSTATGVERDARRLRRLKKDESLASAMSALKAERAKLAQARLAAANALIQSGDLVIVASGGAGDGPAAVAIGPTSSTQRTAIHDDKPPHRDGITIYPGGTTRTGAPTINVVYLAQVEPPATQNAGGGNILFEITGDPSNPSAVAQITYNDKPMKLEMKHDAALHKQITARFNAELARLEKIKQPMIDALKDFVMLEGMSDSGTPAAPQPNLVRFTLVRDKDKGTYAGEGSLTQATYGGGSRTSPFTPPSASIVVIDDKPMLVIDSLNTQFQLTLDDSGNKLTGGWFMTGNPNGWAVDLNILKARDAKTHQAEVEAQRKALASLDGKTPFIGTTVLSTNFLPQPSPISLTLTSGPADAVTGKLTVPMVAGVYEVQGKIVDTISGPRLALQPTQLTEAGTLHANSLFNSIRHQQIVLDVADPTPGAVVLSDGSQPLTQLSDSFKAKLIKQLADAAGKGLMMSLTFPDYGPNQQPLNFKITIDSEGKVQGATTDGPRYGDFHEKSTIAGTLKDYAGLPMLDVQIADPTPAKAGAFQRIYVARLIALPTDKGWTLAGDYWPLTNANARNYLRMIEIKN